MENNNNYRIIEQFGYFRIQNEIIDVEEVHSFLSRVFPFWFKPKIDISIQWQTVKRPFSLFEQLNFKTKEKAIEYISKLEPKYHYLEKRPKFPKDRN